MQIRRIWEFLGIRMTRTLQHSKQRKGRPQPANFKADQWTAFFVPRICSLWRLCLLCRSILVGNGDSLLYAFPVCLQRHLWAKADVPGAAAETAGGVAIPSERTVYRVMKEIGQVHHPKRKPNGITKADRETRKSDDLLKRDFSADKPLEKCVTDITELKAKDGKLYVSAIFDCFDLTVLSLATQFRTAQRGVFGGHELLVLHRFFDDGQQQGPLSVPARAAIRLHQPVVGPAVPLLRRQGRVGTAGGDGAAGGNDLAGGAQDCDHAALDDHLKLSAKIQLQSSVMITQAASVYKDLLF